MIVRLLLSVALLLPSLQEEPPSTPPAAGVVARDAGAAPSAARVVARGAGAEVSLSQLEALLMERKGMSDEGRRALEEMLKARVVADIAKDSGIEVSDREVEALFSDLDRQTRASNPKSGLLQELEKRGISVDQFIELLRLSIVQEQLTRKALGIPEERRASGEEQELWLQQQMAARGLERPAPPWEDGLVAICGSVSIDTQEFGEFLRVSLPENDVVDAAWHLLLVDALERKLIDLAPAVLAEAVDAEFARRQREHLAAYPEIPYAQRLGVQGRTLDGVHYGVSVRIAALTRLWVDRENGEEGLRRAYTTERQYFDGLFGRSVECYLIFLRAAKFVNTLNQRNFGDAHRQLNEYRANIATLDDFKALCVKYSENTESRTRQGALGFIASGTPSVPHEMRQAIFGYVDSNEIGEGVMIPNVQINDGVGLLWLESLRPAPTWEVMQERVHNELRKRLINSILPRTAVELLPIPPK